MKTFLPRKLPKRYGRLLDQINQLADSVRQLKDEQLRGKTQEFRSRLGGGETLEELLPEAYAVLREASRRVLGLYPYDVQVLAAIALHESKIIDMGTGEGKTLTAAMPLYLNALTGKSTILVTVNNYLARRDGEEMGRIYGFLGMSTGIAAYEGDPREYTPERKRSIFASDIVYATSGGLAFDYLSENLGTSRDDWFLRDFYYVIIDEADAVLLDAAVMPLIITGAARLQSNLYEVADAFVSILREGEEYFHEEGKVCLTEQGMERACRFFSIDSLYDGGHFELVRHIQLALQAHALFHRNEHYVVQDGELLLLDQSSGRSLPNTKLSAGLHQALEAKEGLKPGRATRAMASITYQHFYRMFPKVAGMSGTAALDAQEFQELYGLDLAIIPPNRKLIREDLPDRAFSTRREQLSAALEEIKELHIQGRPVLVITESIDLARLCSRELLREGIAHSLLTAFHLPREAKIIAAAGGKGVVTVATAIAGRGTDIRLTEEARKAGGLAIIGIGRMSSRKLEAQARGRAGRQGDPGSSRFYLSLEDRIVREAWPERENEEPTRRMRRNPAATLRRAQRLMEEKAAKSRQATMDLSVSILVQRELVYDTRRKLIAGEKLAPETLEGTFRQAIETFLRDRGTRISAVDLMGYVHENISYWQDWPKEEALSREQARSWLLELAQRRLEEQKGKLKTDEDRQNFLRAMVLRAIDEHWIDEIDYLQQLRTIVGGRRYANLNEIYEYHREAHKAYINLQTRLSTTVMRMILLSDIQYDKEGYMHFGLP